MHYFIAYNTTGAPVALLEAADRVDAELYALRELRAFGRVSEADAPEQAEARLTAGYLARGLNPAQASVAAQDTLALLRPRTITVPRQEAQLLADSRTPTKKAGAVSLHEITRQPASQVHELREAPDVRKALEESWRRLHPEFTDEQIRIVCEG